MLNSELNSGETHLDNVSDDIFSAVDKELLEEFNVLLDKDPLPSPKSMGRILQGHVIEVNRKQNKVLVDVGLKSEGVIALNEFVDDEGKQVDVNEGDIFDCAVLSFETRESVLRVSRSKVIRERSWLELQDAFKNGKTVKGIIFARIRGGLCVDMRGIIGFLPGGQIDIRIVKDVTPIIGIEQDFKILSIDKKFKSLVVSRRAVLEEMRSDKKTEFLQRVKQGDELDGVVKNITNYGAFVDLGSIDGLMHIADITWEKIAHPSEKLKIGDAVRVSVIKIDPAGQRISLGMKQLQENPWSYLESKYKPGDKITTNVMNITEYGVFVEIEPHVEGLIHVSEMGWTKEGVKDFFNSIKIGSSVDVCVLAIDVEQRRISLSKKRVFENPWDQFISSHKAGDILDGQVASVTNFGLFVSLNPMISGLVYITDITWNGNPEEELKKYQVGDNIKCVYLSGDVEKQRISLSIKQISESPADKYKDQLFPGATVTAVVTSVDNDGIEILALNTFKSYIKRSQIAIDKQEQRTSRFAIGDKVDAKVLKFDAESCDLQLSIKKLEEDERQKILTEYGTTDSGASLGKILTDAIELSIEKDKK